MLLKLLSYNWLISIQFIIELGSTGTHHAAGATFLQKKITYCKETITPQRENLADYLGAGGPLGQEIQKQQPEK